jgi:RNA polymerase sigma-70 factor (ECF subfamily)
MFLRFRRKSDSKGPSFPDLQDPELIQLYRSSRNTEIIAVLFQRYTHLVYGVCLKYLNNSDEAEDAVMEIFEGLMDSLLEHEVTNFKSWLHSVTRNHCLMKLRKMKSVVMDMEIISEKIDRDIMENEDLLHQEDVMDRFKPEDLGPVLKSLREPQRRCIELVYLEEKSYQEVCEITGYTMNEVKSHVQNGKRNLKLRLEAGNE